MRLTNAQRGTLTDALGDACVFLRSLIHNHVPASSFEDMENLKEWRASLKRYRDLRKAYLVEEKESLEEFAKEKKKFMCFVRKNARRKKR